MAIIPGLRQNGVAGGGILFIGPGCPAINTVIYGGNVFSLKFKWETSCKFTPFTASGSGNAQPLDCGPGGMRMGVGISGMGTRKTTKAIE